MPNTQLAIPTITVAKVLVVSSGAWGMHEILRAIGQLKQHTNAEPK